MYKATIRALLRHSIKRLNAGDYSMMLKMASPDFALAFPGDNSWSTKFRPAQQGRHQHITHQGIEEATAFAERFVSEGIQFHIEDILVNGGPWNTRIALRVHDFIPSGDGGEDVYNNQRGRLPGAPVGPARALGRLRRHPTHRCPGRAAEVAVARAASDVLPYRCRRHRSRL